jgi:division protein CdvB (Snf7/Vps24/ESCRT-III family)
MKTLKQELDKLRKEDRRDRDNEQLWDSLHQAHAYINKIVERVDALEARLEAAKPEAGKE